MSGSNQPWLAEIRCFSGEQTAPVPVVASVRFYPVGSQIPPSGYASPGFPVINYPLDRFSDVVSIFRDSREVIVDRIEYDTAGQTVDCWAVAGGFEQSGLMQPQRTS